MAGFSDSCFSEIDGCRKNCRIYVRASNEEGGKLIPCVIKIIKSQALYVGESAKDSPYELLIDLDMGKIVHGETLTCQPELSISIRLNGSDSADKLSYQKSLAKQSGFTEAQAFVDRKILASAEEELKASLGEELKKILGFGKS